MAWTRASQPPSWSAFEGRLSRDLCESHSGSLSEKKASDPQGIVVSHLHSSDYSTWFGQTWLFSPRVFALTMYQHCSNNHFTHINSLQPLKTPVRQVLLVSPFYGWETWGTERLSNLLTVIQPRNGGSRAGYILIFLFFFKGAEKNDSIFCA